MYGKLYPISGRCTSLGPLEGNRRLPIRGYQTKAAAATGISGLVKSGRRDHSPAEND